MHSLRVWRKAHEQLPSPFGRGAGVRGHFQCRGARVSNLYLKSRIQCTLDAWAAQTFGLVGICPTRTTPTSDLDALIRGLHPIAPDIEFIRLGPQQDGGYLIPDDLDGVRACFSPGVGKKSGFEQACAERGRFVFLADQSVAAPAFAHERFVFTQKNVGAVSAAERMTLDEWVRAALPDDDAADLLLQMDIEGDEYETLLGMPDALLKRFRILVIEFHMLDKLWSAPFFRVTAPVFQKILRHHTCVHLHPNNCCGAVTRGGIQIPRTMEFTFLRNDRLQSSTFATHLPHPLDRDNTPKRSIALPRCWYRNLKT